MKGSIIKKRLLQTGTKQVELAKLLGITPQAVAGIFAATDVRTGTVERICEVLNLPVTFFYNDAPDYAETHREPAMGKHNGKIDKTAIDNAKGEAERDREIQYLRGQVAAYETALSLLRSTPLTSPDPTTD